MWNAIKLALGMKPQFQRAQDPDTHKNIAFLDRMGRVLTPPADPAAALGHATASQTLFDAIRRRAGELELQVSVKGVLAVQIDGVVHTLSPVEREAGSAMIRQLKQYAGLDPAEIRKPQRGDLTARALGRTIRLTVSTLATSAGEVLNVRIFQGEDVLFRLEDLGLLQRQLEQVQAAIQSEKRAILVAHAKRQGASTTLYALAREHDAFMKNILLFERQSLTALDNIRQFVVPYDTPAQSLLAHLKEQLIAEPDLLIIDPIDNAPLAQAAAQAAAAGRGLYASVDAGDSFAAIAQWTRLVGEPALAARELSVVIAAKLIRKLCPDCREAYVPEPSLLRKLNLPADRIAQLYRAPGKPKLDPKGKPLICETCQGTGYFGQMAIFEVLPITEELRSAIAENAAAETLRKLARKDRMLFVQEVGLRRVIEGVTSVQEILRISQA